MAKSTSSVFSFIRPANKLFMSVLPAVALMVIFVLVSVLPGKFFLLTLLNIVVSFATIGLSLCLPLLFEYRQKHKSLPWSYMYSVVSSTTKKSAPGVFGLFMLFILCVFIITIVLYALLFQNVSLNDNQLLRWATSPWGAVVIAGVIGFVQGILVTVPIFYSFKKKGLVSSIRQSIQYSFSHIDLTGFIIAVQMVGFLLFTAVPRMLNFSPIFIFSLLNAILDIWITCFAYLYYKKNEA